MRRFAQAALLLLVCHTTFAQVIVRGKVTNDQQLPVSFAIVSARQGNTVAANAVTDSAGNYQFINLKRGSYKFVFKTRIYRDSVVAAVINTDTVVNVTFSKTLSEVVVRSQKPIIQREMDRLRFNVGGTDLVIGNNIWDVMEKTPLVSVSADGGIQISGTTGAVVYINNRRKVLAGGALKSYLSSMPADNLESIEVITTPPSKYDAEGGAGIINIITKKSKEEGLIGNAVLSDRQTNLNSQSGSLYLNNRQGKWNTYSSIYFADRQRKPVYRKDIYYPADDDAADGLLHRSVLSDNQFRILSPGANLGVDYQINSRHVVGMLLDYAGDWHKETRNAYSVDHYQQTDSLTLTNNNDHLSSQNYALNLNYQGQLDSGGKKISVDFDALEYRSTNNSVSKTMALNAFSHQALALNDWFRSASPQHISNQSLKVDFTWPVNKNTSFDFGGKLSLSKINNDLLYENNPGDDTWVKDPTRSNRFRYNENIGALYFILHHKINASWAYQLGARVENTNAQGWLEGVKVVNRNYINVFPTVFLKYKTYVLAVSSRITRPSFWDVNPFRMYTTDQTYYEGNPFLKPSKYYRQELSHTVKSFTFQLAASQLFDEFYALPYNPGGGVIANKKVNYGNKYGFSHALIYYDRPRPWWQVSGTLLTGYVISKGNYADSIRIDNHSFLLTLSTNQTFVLSKKNGWYCTVIASNTFPVTIVNTNIGNRLDTEIRLRKSMGNVNLVLSVQDLFKSNQDRYKIYLDDLRIMDKNYYDTRSVALTLSYNFGKSSVKDKRDRDTGNDDIKKRLN